jgi:hypothetical protein
VSPEAGFLDEIQTKDISSLLFKVTSAALPRKFYFFKLTQPLTFSTIQLLYSVQEKGGKPERKSCPVPYGLRNLHRNFKSENTEDYAHCSSYQFLCKL